MCGRDWSSDVCSSDLLKDAIEAAGKNDVIDPTYPYRKRMERETYEETLSALQLELSKLQDRKSVV